MVEQKNSGELTADKVLLKIKLAISPQVLRILVDFMSPVSAEIGEHDKNVITAFESS